MANEHAGGKPDQSFSIKVNGRTETVTAKKQFYRDIVALAYPQPNFDNFLYTVTFFKGESDKEGDLTEGDFVNVKDEMVFNVRRSDKS